MTVVDEYRVELALAEQGWLEPTDWLEKIPAALREFGAAIREVLPRRSEPFDVCYETVKARFWDIATAIAYMAAEANGSQNRRQSTAPEWARYLQQDWDQICDCLSAVPSAHVPMPPDQLEAGVRNVATLMRQWLGTIGFRFDDVEAGEVYVHIDRRDF